LVGFGEAVAHGAATIVNAISIGRGAAFGVDLWTKARVQLTRTPRQIEGKILSDPDEDSALLRETVSTVLRYFRVEDKFGALAETESNIPIAKGLKSSSVASNALVLATVGALGRRVDDFTAVNLGVDASIKAKATITGAFDDACASFFGNIVVTDNAARKVLHFAKMEEDLVVLLYVPKAKSYTFTSDVDRMKLIAPQVDVAFNEALRGNYWTALTLNGLLYSAALNLDPKPAIDALEAGAVASGLSGKGPAVVAVAHGKNVNRVVRAWTAYDGEILRGRVNRDKARITRKES
jgi:shikimate kinase